MPRWKPDARSRLTEAAIDLFAEQGYETTTVDEIAARAGLTRSTFFRHYRDKRDVLFGGQAEMTEAIAAAVRDADPDASPLAATEQALLAAADAAFTPERRPWAMRRTPVVAAHPELRERELLKRDGITTTLTESLTARGADPVEAAVVAHLAAVALDLALHDWISPVEDVDFATAVRRRLTEVTATAARLSDDS